METVARIRRADFVQGKSIKAIAREFGLARNKVRPVLRYGETSPTYKRTIQPRPKMGTWAEELERRLSANDRQSRRERLDLIRIYEGLQASGAPVVSGRNTLQYVARHATVLRRIWVHRVDPGMEDKGRQNCLRRRFAQGLPGGSDPGRAPPSRATECGANGGGPAGATGKPAAHADRRP